MHIIASTVLYTLEQPFSKCVMISFIGSAAQGKVSRCFFFFFFFTLSCFPEWRFRLSLSIFLARYKMKVLYLVILLFHTLYYTLLFFLSSISSAPTTLSFCSVRGVPNYYLFTLLRFVLGSCY
uniref:Uncharacterized protein n=1 Tax=Cacopsylla melanoneura TaxID=428564 RepID=A0A8D9AGV6_9HEMI